MKNLKVRLLYILALIMLCSSCSLERMEDLLEPLVKAPGATIERGVKGHDQIYTVSAILRMSIPVSGSDYYAAYGISNIKRPPVPLYQQIDITKDENGQINITSERKHFDVIKSKEFYSYSLELKYYDLNGKMINYQFSSFDNKHPAEGNLVHHQHFFTIHNYSLEGELMRYPTTLDGKFIDDLTFLTNSSGKRIPASQVSASNVYVPEDAPDAPVTYYKELGLMAAERATTKKALDAYEFEGKKYRLYKTLNITQLNEKAKDVFSYEYRDTDPVDSYVGSKIKGHDDMDRVRTGQRTTWLRQRRKLEGQLFDYLGFKGNLRFKRSDIIFQLRICIAHMITETEKYKGIRRQNGQLPYEHYQISPAWNSYDIDYPLEFRVIADLDGDKDKFVEDVKRVYPEADKEQLLKMFDKTGEWFAHIPWVSM